MICLPQPQGAVIAAMPLAAFVTESSQRLTEIVRCEQRKAWRQKRGYEGNLKKFLVMEGVLPQGGLSTRQVK